MHLLKWLCCHSRNNTGAVDSEISSTVHHRSSAAELSELRNPLLSINNINGDTHVNGHDELNQSYLRLRRRAGSSPEGSLSSKPAVTCEPLQNAAHHHQKCSKSSGRKKRKGSLKVALPNDSGNLSFSTSCPNLIHPKVFSVTYLSDPTSRRKTISLDIISVEDFVQDYQYENLSTDILSSRSSTTLLSSQITPLGCKDIVDNSPVSTHKHASVDAQSAFSEVSPVKTSNELLTPEILDDPVSLAKLGFAYPPGYGPPYPPLPIHVALLYSRRAAESEDGSSSDECNLEIHTVVHDGSNPISPRSSSCSESDLENSSSNFPSPLEASFESGIGLERTAPQREFIEKSSCVPELDDASLWWISADYLVELPYIKKFLSRFTDKSTSSHHSCLHILFELFHLNYPQNPLDNSVSDFPHDSSDKSIVDLVLTRISSGLHPADFVSLTDTHSQQQLYGRFFPTHPRPGHLSLDRMLSFWLRKGLVPVLCMNFSDKSSVATWGNQDSGWQYRIVYKVDRGRIHLMFPLSVMGVDELWRKLDVDRIQYVKPETVLMDIEGNVREVGKLRDLESVGDELNVPGQIAYFHEHASSFLSPFSPEDFEDDPIMTLLLCGNGPPRRSGLQCELNALTLPTMMESGILLFAKSCDVTLCEMLRNINEPLEDRKV